MFQRNGISLHLEDHGSGEPVVLLHGYAPLSRAGSVALTTYKTLKRKADAANLLGLVNTKEKQ